MDKLELKKKKPVQDIPVYEISIDMEDETGINLISLVENPAVEVKGLYFNDIKELEFKSIKEKKMIVGPAMIANKYIYRRDDDGREYYVVFTEKAIRDIVMKFKSQFNNRRINIDHSDRMVDGYIMSDWIIESSEYDKSKMYGFNLPVGSYFIEVKIEDEDFWNSEVKENGKFGFSVEGLFSFKSLNFTIDNIVDDLSEDEMQEILNFLKNISI